MTVLYEKNQIYLRTATAEDAKLLAAVLRPKDQAELSASFPGLLPKELIGRFINISSGSVALFYRGDVVALGGIYPFSWVGSRACVWLLTGPKIEKIPVTFIKLAKRLLTGWLMRYPVLTNQVDARYQAACRLITHLGGSWTGRARLYSNIEFLEFIFRRNYGRNCN